MNIPVEPGERPRVLVIGAGFGGLWTARELTGAPVEVVLLDRNNFHTFYPLLYQVGAAALEGTEMVEPVRTILRGHDNVHFHMGEVRRVDLEGRSVHTRRRSFGYDYLVLATGSTTDYLGVPGAAEHAFPMKEVGEAIVLRNHLLSCFEAAAQEEDPARKSRLLTFVIVGGGATGVELAGAVAELANKPMARDYEEFGRSDIRVVLLEARDGLLPGDEPELGDYAARRLRRMGVEVRTGVRVSRVSPDAVELEDGTTLETRTAVWTAGVRGEPPGEAPGLPVDERGWVRVGPDLRVDGWPNVFALGDLAEVEGERLPLVAQVATQSGSLVAKNVVRLLDGEPTAAFSYHDMGYLGTIGRHAAYGKVFGTTVTGFTAWVMWLVIHVIRLIGFRDRLAVLINWTWDYFLFEKPVRWIMPRGPRNLRGDETIRGWTEAGPVPGEISGSAPGSGSDGGSGPAGGTGPDAG